MYDPYQHRIVGVRMVGTVAVAAASRPGMDTAGRDRPPALGMVHLAALVMSWEPAEKKNNTLHGKRFRCTFLVTDMRIGRRLSDRSLRLRLHVLRFFGVKVIILWWLIA